ncbi:MAG: Hsp20/alpha crystallin family protein [Bacteroidales bacterium]|nr:Hsp20/alpha crystallin family protein [Bacteroidales bacterium]MCF8351311.1 Hsp20/alpha crystallin family protein [Bacteroidales bacterium]MCF8376899.1 Hsp20/alpha crystallin family protein [Bacteroidales bacterium]MCF8400832.1 Hsp20/alpha crystallin family protein [Bacteroidales bacterium]
MIRRRALPDLVDEFFGSDLMNNFFENQTGINVPAVNIIEGNEDFKIEVAAPGLNKKDFKIDLDRNVLTVSSEKKEEKKEKDEDKFMRREFSYSSFSRSFTLPDSVDEDKVSANHQDGVLTVTIPKKEEARPRPPRQIDIK